MELPTVAYELSFVDGDGRVIIMANVNAKVCECILFTCRTAALSSSPSLLPMLALPVVRQKAVCNNFQSLVFRRKVKVVGNIKNPVFRPTLWRFSPSPSQILTICMGNQLYMLITSPITFPLTRH